MATQAFMKERTVLYNPGRDLAHNADKVFQVLAARLEDGEWPVLTQLCDEHGVTMDDLGEGCRVYIETLAGPQTPEDTLETRLKQTGWFDLPEVAQVAIMATVGTVILGMQFAGIRERLSASSDEDPGAGDPEIVAAGRESAAVIARAGWPAWLRRVVPQRRLSRSV